MDSQNRTRTLLVAFAVALCALPVASASADRQYQLRWGKLERGDITMAANTVVDCPSAHRDCANARAGVGPVLKNGAFLMAPIDVDSDPSTFDSSSADLRVPAGATVMYAALYWASDTKAMPEGVDAPNPSARGTMRLAAPDGAGYRTITATQVDFDRYYPSRYQGFADVTQLVRAAGNGTYTAANIQASTGRDQYGGWALVVAYRDPSKPVRQINVYDGFRSFSGDDEETIALGGFQTPASGTVRADLGMVAWEGDLGTQPDYGRLNGRDVVDALHPAGNYWTASIAERGQRITTRRPNHVNTFGVDANTIAVDGFLPNGSTALTFYMEVATDLVMPGAMTLVTDAAASAPANSAVPVVSGAAREGETLTVTDGAWTGTGPLAYARQWRRCDAGGGSCADIPGATGASYTLGAGDSGRTIRVQVTATNVVSSVATSSGQTAAVVPFPPASTAAPSVSGAARERETLSATDGSWTGRGPIDVARQWQRCDAVGGACADITGAIGATYLLAAEDVGYAIRLVETASNAGGSATATSSRTAPVEAKPTPPPPDPPPSDPPPSDPPPDPPPSDPPPSDPPPSDPPPSDPPPAGPPGSDAPPADPPGGGSPPASDPPASDPPTNSLPPLAADPPATPALASMSATQWRSTTGTGLRLRVASRDPIARLGLAIPATLRPNRRDAGRIGGRITVYPAAGDPRTFALRVTARGGLVATTRRGPRLALASGQLRLTGIPEGVRTIRLTLYTRDATSPRALLRPGHATDLSGSVRTAAGALHPIAYRLAA